VRSTRSGDSGLADAIDRAVRGSAHGPDHEVMASQTTRYVVDDSDGRGYAYARDDGEVYLLAATDEATATALLWRCLAHGVELDQEVAVEHLTAGQQWAIEVAYRARLRVKPAGPVFWRGGAPPANYLPSGAYL
jgi:hypothetical protein